MSGRTALYRLYDADGHLLYVGVTDRPSVRFAQHEADKAWWPEVATKEITWRRTRQAALKAELRAIQREHPRYNKMGAVAPGAERWTPRLRRRARVITQRRRELEQDIAGARRAGHSFREIGRWADVNHETARTIAIRLNGDPRTQAEIDAP